MTMITINPDKLFTVADFSRIAGVQTASARQWMKRHWQEMPAPLLSIPLGSTGPRKVLHVWDQEAGERILELYRRAMAAWPPNQWSANPSTGDSTSTEDGE